MTLTLSQLKPDKGSTKPSKRVGRGNSSGMGTYSGRGQKGQRSRKGKKLKSWFEGGQTSFLQRLPKLKGFTSRNGVNYLSINLDVLEENFNDKDEVNRSTLFNKKLINKLNTPYKILGSGDISKSLNVTAHGISKSAKEKIEKAKGKVTLIQYKKKAKVTLEK